MHTFIMHAHADERTNIHSFIHSLAEGGECETKRKQCTHARAHPLEQQYENNLEKGQNVLLLLLLLLLLLFLSKKEAPEANVARSIVRGNAAVRVQNERDASAT